MSQTLSEENIKKMKKRRRVAQELLETEIAYVSNIEMLKACFYDPLHENSKSKQESERVISSDDVRTIFGSLNIILPVNRLLLGELRKNLEVPETSILLIGPPFGTLAYCLKSYTAYCNDFDNARRILGRLKKNNSSFATFFNDISSNETLKGKTIFDLMILPVQRIPRYKMLLLEILKNTWEEHPDYRGLSEACENVASTTQSIEDSQNSLANSNKILEIQNDLKIPKKMEKELGPLLRADRKFIGAASFRCSENDSNDINPKKLLLFNDILLVTKATQEKLKEDKKKTREVMRLKRIIYLNELTNVIKSSSVETQPSLTFEIGESQFHMHIEDTKNQTLWFQHFTTCRKYAIQKKEMNDRSAKPRSTTEVSKNHRTRFGSTLKRKKTTTQLSATPTEVVVDNPLFGMKKLGGSGGKGRRLSVLIEEEGVKKSPSMNAMVDPTKKNKFQMATVESESGNEIRAAAQKHLSRSTSVDALGKIVKKGTLKTKPRAIDTSQLND